jgi:cytochrome c oxidase cbb3-type subunit 3/ubiquinol-cytochrome c reductase cytochrome c subunit
VNATFATLGWPGRLAAAAALVLLAAVAAGCDALPGKPRLADREPLPSEVMSFATLYRTNCAGCHGADGRLGGSRPLNDPLYLALVPRERLRDVIARGVPGTAQPAFAVASGGSLTDPQIDAIVRGLGETWARPEAVRGVEPPAYAAAPGDPERGKAVYAIACAACHGAEGTGGPKGGAVADPSYLALVSDQYLRTTVIAGRTDLGMPDWRGYVPGQPLTAAQVADVVAWLASARRPVAGRPSLATR